MNVNTKLIDMDVLIAEQVIKNNDDSYTVLLNARLSHERQLEAYYHAIKHIQNNDFEKYDSGQIELCAHNLELSRN